MKDKETKILILSVFIAGLCSIIYELLIATASSYFLGDSIKQFSITIGFYMAAMGVGSYLSRLISDDDLLLKFIRFELLLGLIGGFSVPLLYTAFAYTDYFQTSSIILTICIGVLIGLEIPFLSRLLEKHYSLKVNISYVLSVGYFGALIATLIFPFLLLPLLGTFKTSVFFGLINMTIAIILLWCFSDMISLSKKKLLWIHTFLVILLLGGVFLLSNTLLEQWGNNLYNDRIVFSKETHYQNVVITKDKDDVRLYLNGHLQFSSSDEYRYHESLVHVPLGFLSNPESILILGGGDGLGVREVLKYSSVKHITLVDLDPEISHLAQNNHHLLNLNLNSLAHPKVHVVNADAYQFLLKNRTQYDAIVIDLPDPNNTSLARLYSTEFYKLVGINLKPNGLFVTQASSPFYARKAYWTTYATIQSAGFDFTLPYHVNVPSFGEWGFIIGSYRSRKSVQWSLTVETKFLDEGIVDRAWVFGKDIAYRKLTPSSIDHPKVLEHYLKGWMYWN
ncbi:spermidine synthase [Candidatus Endobugula sertula]|uniref:Polyamine aminopropyltransferase n=1 Tax=Candidatus Endobugula sertula TaxID=62101 RepID=A0A1D2QRD3_9GAMM|nr:spermidine synthase [Candidatus Endobugula sertula]